MRRRRCIIAILSLSGFLVLVAYLDGKTVQTEIAKKRIRPDIDDMLQTIEELHKKRSRLNKYLLQPHGKRNLTEEQDKLYSEARHEIVYEILQKKRGFFLEISVHDDKYLSNTFWLESKHDWTGLLIERNPDVCKKIDKLERNAWRLCACLSYSPKSVTKSRDEAGTEVHIERHMKNLDKNKNVGQCFSIEQVLDAISVHHIDFVSLDINRLNLTILDTLKYGLKHGSYIVDVWHIKYKVWDGNQIVIEKSENNSNALRKYFDEIGGYFELTSSSDTKYRWAPGVLFVRTGEWCKTREKLPNGTYCRGKERASRIDNFLLRPFPYKKMKDADKQYSQAKQDEVIYNIFQKEGGFFVEIGAHDGQNLSNTLWLERQHFWSGLLIEANPDLCQKLDKLKRHAWRICACLSSTKRSVIFIKGEVDTLGGIESHIDEHHMKVMDKNSKIIVPCCDLMDVLDKIKIYHIDFFSLDFEGAEMAVLESVRNGLESSRFTVDVWSIEYRVWDGKHVVYEKSIDNLRSLRQYFNDIGGYSEYTQLSNDENVSDGYALDVVFVRNKSYCEKYDSLPDGTKCAG